ncbi:MAG TPA: hypothetical protein VKM55_19715 [Candidatus Lokiarchaeia archaeon]|nr:hypothetical protein [Candidatus Lokiarchaeia archaeon]
MLSDETHDPKRGEIINKAIDDPVRDKVINQAIDNPAREQAINKYLDDLEDQARMTPDAYAKKKRMHEDS